MDTHTRLSIAPDPLLGEMSTRVGLKHANVGHVDSRDNIGNTAFSQKPYEYSARISSVVGFKACKYVALMRTTMTAANKKAMSEVQNCNGTRNTHLLLPRRCA